MTARHLQYFVVAALVLSATGAVWPNTNAEPTGETPRARTAAADLAIDQAERALDLEVQRLQRRMDAMARVQQPTRNPFAWGRSTPAPARRAAVGSTESTAVPPPPVPSVPFTLIGIAADETSSEPRRFAMLDWNDELVIAGRGDRFGGRYLVERIEAAAVEVAIDGHSASVIRLTLEDR